MQHTFDTPGPVELVLELGAGRVTVTAGDTATTSVAVEGQAAEETAVDQHDGRVSVIAPRQRSGLLRSTPPLFVSVTLPAGSALTARLGAADLVASGRYGTARVRSASGDVRIEELTGEAQVETGSGEVVLEHTGGETRVRSGSGDVEVRHAAAPLAVATGSGDVSLGSTEGEAELRSGAGDLRVRDAHTDLTVSTASGDVSVGCFRRGTLRAKGVSGDVRVGIPAGIPVWTDVSCLTGTVQSTLEGAGRPEEGQDYIELRATTVSGDIHLDQL